MSSEITTTSANEENVIEFVLDVNVYEDITLEISKELHFTLNI